MSFLLDILREMGVGGQVLTGVMLFVAAFYLIKFVSVGKMVGGMVSSATGYGIVLLVAIGAAIALGWLDPNVGTVSGHISGVTSFVWDLVGDLVVDQIEGVMVLSDG